jgi:hypothetical protein
MDDDIKRAMKSYAQEECHKRWNNKNTRDIKRPKVGKNQRTIAWILRRKEA